MNNRLISLDYAKLFFSIMIPLLHINFDSDIVVVDCLRQYVSRLGVPFFFSVSGLFLYKSVLKRGSLSAWLCFVRRIGVLLLFWLLIYSPLLVNNYSIPEIIFRTPAYLWYLTALLWVSIPFCFIKNRFVLYIMSVILYCVGTYFNGSYYWISLGWKFYTDMFGTTRNGLLFPLCLMCAGEVAFRLYRIKKKMALFILFISTILLIVEITYTFQFHVKGMDNSLYFGIPIFTLSLVYILINYCNFHIKENDSFFNLNSKVSLLSSSIYFMQYGVISVFLFLLKNVNPFIIYSFIIIIPIFYILLFGNNYYFKIINNKFF